MSEKKTQWYKYRGSDKWALTQDKFRYLGQDEGLQVYGDTRHHVFESSEQEGALFITKVGPNDPNNIWKPIRDCVEFGALPRGTLFYSNGSRGVKIGPGVAYLKGIGWSTMGYNLLVDVDTEVEADLVNVDGSLEELFDNE